VLYFAAVRDLVGVNEEELDLPASVSRVSDLVAELPLVHPELAGRLGGVRVAVNEEFAQDADPIRPGDVVALIPPVAGG
jgi:molybdopterin converting factor subunit 1